MSDRLLIIGNDTAEIKKLLLKLFVAETESIQSVPTDNSNFVCVSNDKIEASERLKTLGYKTVMIAYTDELMNKSIGNSDLEEYGYKFEDGM